MIKMVMGDKNRRKRIEVHVIFLKHLLETTQADSGIYYDSISAVSEIIAVTATAAGKTHELNHQHCPSIIIEESSSNSAIKTERSVPG
jgi:hypothetical protein